MLLGVCSGHSDGWPEDFPADSDSVYMFKDRLFVWRNELRLTQAELGKELRKHLEVSEGYAQKLISMWEKGQTSPTPKQIEALARALGKEIADVQQYVEATSAGPAVALFEGLAESERSSLVLVCFTAPPKAPSESLLLRAVLAGLKNKMSFAMVVPCNPTTQADQAGNLLQPYYSAVAYDVGTYCQMLGRDPAVRQHLGMFMPRLEKSSALVPPYTSRQLMLVTDAGEGFYDTELHLWVKTNDIDTLQKSGEPASDSSFTEKKVWEAYFAPIVEFWKSAGHSLKNPETASKFGDWNGFVPSQWS